MEVSIPTWNGATKSYTFTILGTKLFVEETVFWENETKNLDIPATNPTQITEFVNEFLEVSKKYFTNPLASEKVLRHLRQTIRTTGLPTESGWYTLQWKPSLFVVKPGEFELAWAVNSFQEASPIIPAEFTASQTPRAQSPLTGQGRSTSSEVPEQTRNIQIHDSLIPVGGLASLRSTSVELYHGSY